MLTCYFGTPGSGKSSLLTLFAVKEYNKMKKGKSKYKHIVSNFPIKNIPTINITDLAEYRFEYCLILLDELTLDVDSRNYKKFDSNLKDFFVLHRHLHCDVIYAVQDPSSIDKRIRDLTYDLFYISRPNIPFLHSFVRTKRIYRNININEYTSELTLGYRFSKFLEGLINHANKSYHIRKAWKYFDSYDLHKLKVRPVYFNEDN